MRCSTATTASGLVAVGEAEGLGVPVGLGLGESEGEGLAISLGDSVGEGAASGCGGLHPTSSPKLRPTRPNMTLELMWRDRQLACCRSCFSAILPISPIHLPFAPVVFPRLPMSQFNPTKTHGPRQSATPLEICTTSGFAAHSGVPHPPSDKTLA